MESSDQYYTIVVTYKWYLSSLDHIKHYSILFLCAEILISSNVNRGNEVIMSMIFSSAERHTHIIYWFFEEIPSMNVLYFKICLRQTVPEFGNFFQGHKSNLTLLFQIQH